MVDPLFQRILVNECRSRKIPVIFDEVFTGFWRLGTEVGYNWYPHVFLFLLFSALTEMYHLLLTERSRTPWL